MKLVTFDDLSPTQDSERALVNLTALGGYLPRGVVKLLRTKSDALAEYGGVFALDEGEVVGQTIVLRLPFRTRTGDSVISGIAGVATRPDRANRGVARAILEEIHRRERAAGQRYAMLWTNRSWGAHHLYEALGYRDVYRPPWAVRVGFDHPERERKYRFRMGRPSDVGSMARLHRRTSRGRRGFVPRPRHSFEIAAESRGFEPQAGMLVAEARGRVDGYALQDATFSRVICGELVARTANAAMALVLQLERRADGRALAFCQEPALQLDSWLGTRGYARSKSAWYVLMAKDLGAQTAQAELVRTLGTSDPEFLCHSSDRF